MFSLSRIKSCFKSFLIFVSSLSATTTKSLLVNKQKLSNLLISQKNYVVNNNKVYIVIYLLLSVISASTTNALVQEKSPSTGSGGSIDDNNYNIDQLGAIFHKVAYATTTTTKRSIIDNIYVPSLTTVPTPSLTTFR